MFRLTALIFVLVQFSFCYANETLIPKLQSYVANIEETPVRLTKARRDTLDRLAELVARRVREAKSVRLLFVCTHNSRRSQMCQLWAQAAACYYGIPKVRCFSGGTEATAFNPRAVATMKRAGFAIKTAVPGENPKYEVAYSRLQAAATAFSKKYAAKENPQREFIAVMVCGDADQKCPVVIGSDARIALHFVDPKVADDTTEEQKAYDQRCRQIADEMLYVMRRVKKLMSK